MSTPAIDSVTALLDELVEAHLDTIEMALEFERDEDWASHVAYLQASTGGR
jgi:hypothetical protein